MSTAVLDHIIGAISPASAAHAEGARLRLAASNLPHLEAVGVALAAAQHSARLRTNFPMVVVVAADHGIADPGVDFGPQHPTTVAVTAIAEGNAAVCHLARHAGASIVVINAGMACAPPVKAAVVALAAGPTAAFTLETAALTRIDIMLAIDAGIALALSLKDAGCDVLGVGTVGLGQAEACAAIAGALIGEALPLAKRDDDLRSFTQLGAAAQLALHRPPALELLAHFGGRDTALLVGLLLACASLNVPVILDDNATLAAAAIASMLAPACVGSFIAAHPGRGAGPALVQFLGVTPVFATALGNGEGSAAAMVLGLARNAAAVTNVS